MINFIKNIFKKSPPKTKHIWKEIRRENLGNYLDFGSSPHDIVTMYRIGIFEECLLTKETRIREVESLFPVEGES